MIKSYTHTCVGTCSRSITLTYDTDTMKVVDLEVVGGCNGNLKGIKELIKGMSLDDVEKKLAGVTCGFKPTSCPDQIAKTCTEIKSSL